MVIMKVDYLYQNTYSLNISDHILVSSRPGSYLIKDAMTVRQTTPNMAMLQKMYLAGVLHL